MDIGANDGSPNTIDAKKCGFSAYSFEPTPQNQANFLIKTPDAVVVEPDYARGEERPRVEVPAHDPLDNKAFLIKSGVADQNGHLNFYAPPCKELGMTCGKNNHLLEEGTEKPRTC